MVNEILYREYQEIDSFRDLNRIYNLFKSNNKINNYERRILKEYFIFSIFFIILLLIFIFIILGTDL